MINSKYNITNIIDIYKQKYNKIIIYKKVYSLYKYPSSLYFTRKLANVACPLNTL